jgi:cytochrome c-type biogenesis protein CcmH/NrfG
LILAAVAFLLVAGLGAFTSYVGNPREATGSEEAISLRLSRSGSNGEMLARLVDYTRSIDEPASMAAAREHDGAIRSTVDGLADRLESSPRDVEGWTLLMRSRVVLGEREAAATAFRRALEVFEDDPSASDEITAAAIELGLKAE